MDVDDVKERGIGIQSADAREARGAQFGEHNTQNNNHIYVVGGLNEIATHDDPSHTGRAYQPSSPLHPTFGQLIAHADTLRTWLDEASLWPLVRECDPIELGVHRAALAQGNAVPLYVARDIDESLMGRVSALSSHGGMVLITGDSTAGKTRTAYEAVCAVAPDKHLFAPSDGIELRSSLPSIVSAGNRCVVWLDDLERYIGPDGLTLTVLSQLRRSRVPIIATMRAEIFRRLTSTSSSAAGIDVELRNEMSQASRLLNQIETVHLHRRWTNPEIERAKEQRDVRLTDALAHRETYGVAEYLAAGPRLFAEWEMSWAVGANPRGAAVVAAAIDCTRAGLAESLTLDMLEVTHHIYLERAGGILLGPESFRSALTWAMQRRYGIASLLLPSKKQNNYRVFDYVYDVALNSPNLQPVPDEVWEAVINHAANDSSQLHRIAQAALIEHRPDLAKKIWQQLGEGGDARSADSLAHLLWHAGDVDSAMPWFRQAAEAGNDKSAANLAFILEGQYKLGEARRWYEVAAKAGNVKAMVSLSSLLRGMDRTTEAEEWLTKATERRTEVEIISFGDTLRLAGKLDEAKEALGAAAAEGNTDAMAALGVVMAQLGNHAEAETLLRNAAEQGSALAMTNLGIMFGNRNQGDKATECYRRAIDMGYDTALYNLSRQLGKDGQLDTVRELLTERALTGDDYAAYCLGSTLSLAGLHEESEPWLRRAADGGNHLAVGRLAFCLEKMGRADEAGPYWIKASEDGDRGAYYHLGVWYEDRGENDRAEEAYLAAASDGDVLAACHLGHLISGRDRVQAETWLQAAIDGGHGHAACTLGLWRMADGNLREAEALWRTAYASGHAEKHVAERLHGLLARQNRGLEAAQWLRIAKGEKVNRRVPKQRSRKRKKHR